MCRSIGIVCCVLRAGDAWHGVLLCNIRVCCEVISDGVVCVVLRGDAVWSGVTWSDMVLYGVMC